MSDVVVRAIETVILSLIGYLVGYIAARRKNNAEALKIEAQAKQIDSEATKNIEQSYSNLIAHFEERLNVLEQRIASLEQERDAYRKEAITLGFKLGEAEKTITMLQNENLTLETKVRDLEAKVKELEAKADAQTTVAKDN